MNRLRLTSALCALLLASAVCSYGQAVNATVLGTITDASGAVVAGAKVTVTEVNTGVSHTGAANESGTSTFPDLPPGKYEVTAEQSGFKKESRRDINVEFNSSTRV